MWKATVLVCGTIVAQQCMQFSDLRGPYETEEACEDRVTEMVVSATDFFKKRGFEDVKPVKTECASDVKQSKV